MSDILIKEASVVILATGKAIDYYTAVLGRRPAYRELITVPLAALSPQSNAVVTAICPQCGAERSTPYSAVTRVKHTFCQPCSQRQGAYGRYIGQHIGRLTITGFAGAVDTGDGGKRTLMTATCDCGAVISIWAQSVSRACREGRLLSCGCYGIERTQQMGLANAGANNAMFRHDLTLKDRVSRRKLLKQVKATWAKRVRRRDSSCIVCGATEDASSHHLYSVRNRPDLCLDDSNGVVLCSQHHEEFHCAYMHHVHAYTTPGDFYTYLKQVHNWTDAQVEQLITSKNLLR